MSTVKEYIASLPAPQRRKAMELRAIIRKAAPQAVERISYGMPYYAYRGRLAYFRVWKNHIGLYIPTPVIAMHRRELKDYETSSATIRFPMDRRFPAALIKTLLRTRMNLNETKAGS